MVNGIPQQVLDVRDPSLKDFIQRHYASGRVLLWGFKEAAKGSWRRAGPGDYIVFYVLNTRKFLYAAKILFLYPFNEGRADQVREAERIAERVWGRDPVDGKTWPYLFFLHDVREIDISFEKFKELTGYRLRAGPRKSVKVDDIKARGLLELLNRVYTPSPARPPRGLRERELSEHERAIKMIRELGELLGYRPEERWRGDGYEYDVVWFVSRSRGPEVPRYVFEVHIGGDLEKALVRLKHAHEIWGSRMFLVSTEDQLRRARERLEGALPELVRLEERGELTLLSISELEEYLEFKRRYKRLDERLRPRY